MKQYRYWKDRGFAQLDPVQFPFGNIRGIGAERHVIDLTLEIYEKFKKTDAAAGIYFFLTPTLFALDLDLIKNILIKDFSYFTDRAVYYNKKVDPVSGHMLAAHGEYWKFLRTKMTPTFTSGKMKMMFDNVLDLSESMVDHLKIREGIVDMKDVAMRFTTDVIGSVAFGLDLNSQNEVDSEFQKMGLQLVRQSKFNILKFFILAVNWKWTQYFPFRKFSKQINDFFMKLVKDAIDYREANNIKRNDFLNLLIQMLDKNKVGDEKSSERKLTLNEVVAQCFIFYIGGFESKYRIFRKGY